MAIGGKERKQFSEQPKYVGLTEVRVIAVNPTAEEFEEYLSDLPKHLVRIDVVAQADGDIINLVFGKEDGSSDRRKVWLDLSVDAINLD